VIPRATGACWSTVRQPGPIAAFYARVKARRGHSIAIVASARKLACLFWCLLTRGEDYAFAQPSLTTKKMRRLELAAGAPSRHGGRDVWSTNQAMRHAERELALQAQHAYERTVATGKPTKRARARHRDAHLKAAKRQAARQGISPRPCALARRRPRPDRTLPRNELPVQTALTFIRRAKEHSRAGKPECRWQARAAAGGGSTSNRESNGRVRHGGPILD
jgi:hypothetical protein